MTIGDSGEMRPRDRTEYFKELFAEAIIKFAKELEFDDDGTRKDIALDDIWAIRKQRDRLLKYLRYDTETKRIKPSK